MSRLVPLVFVAVLPFAVAAPIPPAARVTFGSNGLLTQAELQKLRYDAIPVKDDEKIGDLPAKDDGPNKFELAVHMPRTSFKRGDSIPAYFALRNLTKKRLGLNARLELFHQNLVSWGSCSVDIRDTVANKPVYVVCRGGWRRAGSLVDVPANGFYCEKGDLGHFAAGHPLPVGEYEVSWRYDWTRSAPVRFTVVAAEEKLAVRPKPVPLRFYHVTTEDHDTGPEKVGAPVFWNDATLDPIEAGEMSASLAVGPEGVFVPDIRDIPASDKLVEAWLEWKPYRDGDRATVTLRAAPPHKRVRFLRMPDLYLQAEGHGLDVGVAGAKALRDRKGNDPEIMVTPLTIEVRMPAGWREQTGINKHGRVAVLVTAKELEFPAERVQQLEEKRAEEPGEPLPEWSGVLRTEFVELNFPPRLP